MAVKEKIPCRVCGTLFQPCAYCKANADVFRWRNFACSKECASKYIEETITYRESLKSKNKDAQMKNSSEKRNLQNDKVSIEKNVITSTAKKKTNKHSSESINENKPEIIVDGKTEKITE